MNHSKLKTALQTKKVTIGSWITLAHTAIAEIMSGAGFDWIVVDLEHSVITLREAEELIRVINLSNNVPLIRLTSNDPDQIKRVMDAGSHGIIVPMVNSIEEAKQAISAVYYPPIGKRSVGLARAQGYGSSFNEYKSWLSSDCVLVVQIEHINAVHEIDKILSLPEIDAYLIGPYDLSASMNLAGDFQHPQVIEAINTIKHEASRLNKPGGIHLIDPDLNQLNQYIEEGFTFLPYSMDIRMLDSICKIPFHEVKKYENSRHYSCQDEIQSISR